MPQLPPHETRLNAAPDRCTPAATATCAPADLSRHGEVAAAATAAAGPASSLGRRGVAVPAATTSRGLPAGLTRRGAAAAATTTAATAASSEKQASVSNPTIETVERQRTGFVGSCGGAHAAY